jgi:hypothetical protein
MRFLRTILFIALTIGGDKNEKGAGNEHIKMSSF